MPHAYCSTCQENKSFKNDIPEKCPDCGRPMAAPASSGRMTRCGRCRRPVREYETILWNDRTICLTPCYETVKNRGV